MSWFGHLRPRKTLVAFFLSLGIGLSIGAGHSGASQPLLKLQLEVSINDVPANAIGSFVLGEDGRIGATAAELAELGLKLNATHAADDIVFLDELPTVTYRYDERTQEIFIGADDSERVVREYDATGGDGDPTLVQSGFGAVLNYDLIGSTGNFQVRHASVLDGTSLSLDGRVFSPFGTFSQSGFVRSDRNWRTNLFRLDSTYRLSDPEHLRTYSAGDMITGGLPWTRPIRLGGVQVQRDFSLRPDLITAPLPSVSGSAAVPSSVDVYVNNIKTFSLDVGSGPFTLANIPVISGAGNARVVVRDAAGHETTKTVPFYSSPYALAPGLMSFSAEAGFPRVGFGSAADSYLGSPVGALTVRRGVYDWLTVEGHAEGGSGLINGGAGAIATVGQFGALSGAVSASNLGGNSGAQAQLSFEGNLFGLGINASATRTFGTYDDLASATSVPSSTRDRAESLAKARVARELFRVTVGAPIPFDPSASASASFVHAFNGDGTRSDILSASWSRMVSRDSSLFATAFSDFGTSRNFGAFIGFSTRLLDSVSVSTSVSRGSGGTTGTVDAVKPLGPDAGSFGWRVVDSEGASSYREASLAYRSRIARVEAIASQFKNDFRGRVEVEGAVATMGGGVFLANRIDDGFAVVRAGAPNVPVLYENRQIGVTNARGMILIPNLRSYDRNKITIDPTNLPVNADIATTRSIVAPADRSGVLVDFGVRTDTTSALVVFKLADGAFVPVGSTGTSNAGEEFTVGYDGEAFLTNLAAQNSVAIEMPFGHCAAEFGYTPHADEQVVISPVVCGVTGSNFGQLSSRGLN